MSLVASLLLVTFLVVVNGRTGVVHAQRTQGRELPEQGTYEIRASW
jgi:hypothetical protein